MSIQHRISRPASGSALFCEYFQQTQQGDLFRQPYNGCVFFIHPDWKGPKGSEGTGIFYSEMQIVFSYYFSELIKINSNKQHKKPINGEQW